MKNQRERKGRKVGKKSVVPSFLTKLYQILENSEYHSIVRWAENGKAFVVKNLPEFIERVLPSYFKHNNFASFVRQLNMYDFHKTRNSQNENTFNHKMFSKGQRNLLKLIKRKVNNSNRRSSIESDFSEIPESKVSPKKNLEEVYLSLVKSLEEVSQRQIQIENKIDTVENKNKNFIEENDLLTKEVAEKKTYTKNLEVLIILILEYLMKKKETATGNYLFDIKNENVKNQKNLEEGAKPKNNMDNPSLISSQSRQNSNLIALNSICTLTSKILVKDPNSTLISLSESINEEEKTDLLKNLIGDINDDVLKKILQKNLIKTDLNEGTLNIKPKLKKCISEAGTSASSNINTTPEIYRHNDIETNMSTPTSILSTNECIFKANMKFTKLPLLCTKRKRTDENGVCEFDSGAVNLNLKEKDSMFEEMTKLTPCLITSPMLSPRKRVDSITRKNLNMFFNEGAPNLFTTHISNLSYNTDTFYGFSVDEKQEAPSLINSDNQKFT